MSKSSALSIFINAVTTPVTFGIFFLFFWVLFACVRAIIRSSSRKTSFSAEIREPETWQIYKMKETTLSMCEGRFSENCFSTAADAHAVFPCPAPVAPEDDGAPPEDDGAPPAPLEDDGAPPAPLEDDGALAESYMLRPLPLDQPVKGKPSGCNL